MDEKLIERAVEAAAKADYEVLYSNPDRRNPWDEQSDDFRDVFRSDVRPLVTAALAEVVPLVTAETAKPAIDYCLERGYTLLYAANGPEPDMCVRLAVRDANSLRAEVEAWRATAARVEALHQPAERVYYHATVTECSLCIGRIYPCPTIKALRGDES